MTKILTTIAAATFLMSGAALAQQDGTGGNNVPMEGMMEFPYNTESYDPAIVEFFADEEGMMRSDDDFNARLAEATPEQMEGMNAMCDDIKTQNEVSSNPFTDRCDVVGEKMGAM